MSSKLSLCIFIYSDALSQLLIEHLDHQRHTLDFIGSQSELMGLTEDNLHHIDCLVLENSPDLLALLSDLKARHVLLPIVVLNVQADARIAQTSDYENARSNQSSSTDVSTHARPSSQTTNPTVETLRTHYHDGLLLIQQLEPQSLEAGIHRAIDQFLDLPSSQLLPHLSASLGATQQTSLVLQQRRLASKLKERLGYLGVYYKRNPQYFLRHMSPDERQEFLSDLSRRYREIVLTYFSDSEKTNQHIDEYINTAFFADVSVSQIVEIHMELMDEFSKQLQLEGRSEEILMDYRLTLIDVIAHLCEMYRRSIPRES
ncbi:MAG: circadian clock protein KaiA [Thainema sp.]